MKSTIHIPENHRIRKISETEYSIEPNLPKTWADYDGPNPLYTYSEALVALSKLLALRDVYNKHANPGFTDLSHSIVIVSGVPMVFPYTAFHAPLTFPTRCLADEFLTNFRDLIEIAKPLL